MLSSKQKAIVIGMVGFHAYEYGTEVTIEGSGTDQNGLPTVSAMGQSNKGYPDLPQTLRLCEIAILMPYNPS